MADNFEITTQIRARDDNGHNDFSQDDVVLTATNDRLEVSYCEGEYRDGSDGKPRLVRKEFNFPFSYEEFDQMAIAVRRARRVASITKEGAEE